LDGVFAMNCIIIYAASTNLMVAFSHIDRRRYTIIGASEDDTIGNWSLPEIMGFKQEYALKILNNAGLVIYQQKTWVASKFQCLE
jgi:hypothetical protein